MPSTTKMLLAGLIAATAVTTAESAVTTAKLAAMSGAVGTATVSVEATSSSQNDNNAGGDSTLSASVTATAMGFGVTMAPAFTISTKACKQLATSPTVSLTMTLALPAAMKNAMTVANTALTLSGVSGGIGITAATIETPVVIAVPFAKLASFKLSEFAPAQYKLALQMTGSDVVIKVAVGDMAVYAAGNAIPLTATLTIGDATAITLPVAGLCETGKPSVICAGAGVVCGAMCTAVKLFAPNKYEATIDFAKEGAAFAAKVVDADAKKIAQAYFVKCGAAKDKDCFSIGDTTKGACVVPTPEPDAKSSGSTHVMSAVVAGASLMMALMM